MKTSEILRQARALIKDKKHWTTGYYAKTRWLNRFVSPTSPRAYRFCALGALKHIGSTIEDRSSYYLYEAALELFNSSVLYINDVREDHKAILAMYARAIELAEKNESSN